MPQNYKLYLHRVGRTARAGASGCSITLVGEGTDRKLLKMVIKNATEPVKHRQIVPAVIDQHRQALDELRPTLENLLAEEKEQKLIQQTERELDRAKNLLEHKKEIEARPRKTWFQTSRQKMQAKRRDQQNSTEAQSKSISKKKDNSLGKKRSIKTKTDAGKNKRSRK